MFLITEKYSVRKIIQVFVLVLISNLAINNSYAQKHKILAFGNFTYAVPTHTDFAKISDYGTGYEMGIGFGFGKTMVTGSIGTIKYHLPQQAAGGVILFEEAEYSVTPVKFGIRQSILLGLFLNANLGMAIRNSKGHFLYEAGAGYKLSFFEVGAAYTSYNLSGLKINSFLFKAGLAFKL